MKVFWTEINMQSTPKLVVGCQTFWVRNFGLVAASICIGSEVDRLESAGSQVLCVSSWREWRKQWLQETTK